jgi:hypothetical protein
VLRRAFLALNALVAAATLASALAVLASDLLVDGYREHYRDALWFVVAYAGVQAVMVVAFARDGALVPWCALARTGAAYLFLAFFVDLWPAWRTWTPARYVYQVFEWGEDSRIGLFALVFLGRGAFNTLSAMYLTQQWWGPLRVRRPLLGRVVTALPVAATAFCVWMFLALVREEAAAFSAEAHDVARAVLEGVECDAIRTREGRTVTDIRQRGERRYEVQIRYGCALTHVLVRDPDGRLGTAAAPRGECCEHAFP